MRERCRANDPDADRPPVGKADMLARCRLLSTTALCGALGVMLLAAQAYGNPQGGTVVGGQVTITQTAPNRVDINQTTDRGIINWQGFSIGSGEHTNFKQPSSQSITLNRVVGGNPSEILGRMTANGNVWIVNPQGVFFGPGAQINVGGLLATTHDIKNEDFMAGRYVFQSDRQPPGIIENQGTITAADAGLVAFVAPGVVNHGVITARLGQVALAAGNQFTVDLYGDQKINLALDRKVTETVVGRDGKPLDTLVNNDGSIFADGGRVFLSASAARGIVNNVITAGGVIEARAVDQRGGEIILSGGDGGTTQVTGTLDASGRNAGQSGGMVQVFGGTVALLTGARIDVSGAAGGGTALIGGDLRGGAATPQERATYKVPAVSKLAGPNATTVRVEAGATIMADATTSGRGGAVVVWSDGVTSLYGNISARGGPNGGDGGFIETSGKQKLDFAGTVDRRAPAGLAGMLLLDPESLAIVGNGDTPGLPSSGGTTLTGTSDSSRLSISTLQNALALGDVTVQTGSGGSQSGLIEVATDVRWSTGSALTLSAYGNIIVDTGVTIANTGSGSLNLRADNTGTGAGNVFLLRNGSLVDYSHSTGLVSIYYNPVELPSAISPSQTVNATRYTTPTDYSAEVITNATVPHQLTSYMLVNTVYDLQNINNNLSGNYALGKDIDASVTAGWNNSAGFDPIGNFNTTFIGHFNGQRHTINLLTINRPDSNCVGLFGASGGVITDGISNGVISDIGLTNATITGRNIVGALVGYLGYGLVSDAYATGTVNSPEVRSTTIGGLIGQIELGVLSNSYAATTVTAAAGDVRNGTIEAGGLVGENIGTIQNSYSTGTVRAGNVYPDLTCGGSTQCNSSLVTVGGLVGDQAGSIDQHGNLGGIIASSYATGQVVVGNSAYVANITGFMAAGGLIGLNRYAGHAGQVSYSYATGPITTGTGSFFTGGLIGQDGWPSGDSHESTLSAIQLTSGILPTGFDPSVWTATAGQYPRLIWQTVNGTPVSTAVNFGAGPSTNAPVTDTKPISPVPAQPMTPIVVVPVVHVSGDGNSPPGTGSNTSATTPPVGGSPLNGGILQALSPFQQAPPPAQPTNPNTGNNGSALPNTGVVAGFVVNPMTGGLVSSPPVASNPAKQSAVNDVWYAYDGDEAAIRAVADNAKYASLAEAAYDMSPNNNVYTSNAIGKPLAEAPQFTIIANYGNPNTLFGMHAVVLKDGSGNIIVSFKGSQGGQTEQDWSTDRKLTAGKPINSITEMQDAYQFARYIEKQYGDQNITYVGHSLGGAMAEYAAITSSEAKAITFDAAPLGQSLVSGGVTDANSLRSFQNITNFRGPKDPVTSLANGADVGHEARNVANADSFESSGNVLADFLPGGAADNNHSIDILARSMLIVQQIAKYIPTNSAPPSN